MKLVLAFGTFVVFGLVSTAGAQTVTLTSQLSGNQETPGVSTGSFGAATVTVDVGAQTVAWVIDIFNMPSGLSNAHFHVGGPGVSGPVVVNIAFPAQVSNDFRLTGSAGATNLVPQAGHGIRSWDDFLQSLLGGQIYINIHSNANPGGEVRGQVTRTP